MAINVPFSPGTHLIGPCGHARCDDSGCSGEAQVICSSSAGSRIGADPNLKSNSPPYCLGMLAGSMKVERVRKVSLGARMKILEVVIGSNHRFIQPQTVGKKEGAPIT